jgi:hypothetical protein
MTSPPSLNHNRNKGGMSFDRKLKTSTYTTSASSWQVNRPERAKSLDYLEVVTKRYASAIEPTLEKRANITPQVFSTEPIT